MLSLTEYDLSPMEWHRQVRAWYQEMLVSQPVYYDEKSKCWWVFRHKDVEHVLKDYETFSSARPMNGQESETILTLDPPKHRQMRALVSQAFTPRAIQAMSSRIEQLTNELLDRVIASGHMDVMEDLAHPLPVLVISEMLGLPKEDWAKLKHWSDILLGDFTQEASASGEMIDTAWVPKEELEAMYTYFFQALQERRVVPREDVMTRLLQAEIDGVHLNDQELFGFCITLLVAGNVTTTNLIGNAILCFTEFPEVLAELRADPSLLPNAIEEVLRYLPPLRKPGEGDSVIIGRTLTKDTEIGGKQLHKGETVMVGLGAANFDPTEFAEPDRFDIHRESNRHLSFGHGVHFCIGAPLSRLESRIALTTILQRLQNLHIARDAKIEQVRSGVVFGVKNLPLEFTPA